MILLTIYMCGIGFGNNMYLADITEKMYFNVNGSSKEGKCVKEVVTGNKFLIQNPDKTYIEEKKPYLQIRFIRVTNEAIPVGKKIVVDISNVKFVKVK